MSCPVRVELLGPVRALVDGDPVPLRGKTARTVLATLALFLDSVVSADQLADALWHDDPPLEPSASLRSIVSRLRTQLGRDAIVTDGAGYRLDATVVEVDLTEIEAVMKSRDLREQDPDDLAVMLGRWRGDALVDVAWTPGFEPERARINELRAQLVDCYHEAMLRVGRAEESLPELERDAGLNPLREATQLLLMRALDACKRTADALRAGEDYRSRLVEQTGLDPSPAYEALAIALLAGDTSALPPTHAAPQSPVIPVPRRTWIPPDTPFVGREAELADLERFTNERRLVTVTGPGGVGKTRLVTEFLTHERSEAHGAVHMVSLAALDRSSPVETAVATALGIEVSSTDGIHALSARLAARPSVLVLDNCEHVLASARLLVESLLRSVENLRIVTTSRRRLGLPNEMLIEVGPLFVPSVDALNSAAIRLFMDRVERAAPRLTISETERTVAADICRLVDGLPLALEIAAARVAMFGFDGLRQRLVDGLAIPSTRVADDDRRQATIESTVEWSLALLSSEARDLFDDLSVFPSWFDLASLEQVSPANRAIEAFTEILDSSLVVTDHERPAYRLLEPVRQVSRRQAEPTRRGQIVDRYLAWIGSIIDAIDQYWIDDDRAAVQQLIITHRADIRWSLAHFIADGDATSHGRFANVLARALIDRVDIELIELCRIEVGPSFEGELARCMLAWLQGDFDASAAMVANIRKRLDPDSPFWGYIHWIGSAVYLYQGDLPSLANAAAIAGADEAGYSSMRTESIALWVLGILYSGDAAGAASLLRQTEEILKLSGSGGFVAYSRAEVAAANGDHQAAIDFLATASFEGVAANAAFTQRLTDISRLVLFVAGGHRHQAAALALELIPQLIHAGTLPQAWTAMRHVADLLGQLDAPRLGIVILDSAHADPTATALTGDAIQAEHKLRDILAEQLGGAAIEVETLPLGTVWDAVEPVLRHAAEVPTAGA